MSQLMVALDYPDRDQALAMAGKLRGVVPWVKVGLELFCNTGPNVVSGLKDMGFSVFLDLKFMDIPNTVRGAVLTAAAAGADMLTLHTLGGEKMMSMASSAVNSLPPDQKPLLMGVTVLTSMDASDFFFAQDIDTAGLVLDLALKAKQNGLDGVVCSGLEVKAVKDRAGAGFLGLTPGIRLQDAGDDQKRVVTPGFAVSKGADFLVVGRPVTKSDDPVRAAEMIMEAMNAV